MRRAVCLATAVCALLLAAPVADASVISWDGSGISTGSPYMRPVGIGVAGGDVYVSDSVEHVPPGGISAWGPSEPRVVKFDADGAYQSQWSTDFNYPGYLATDGTSMYVVDWVHYLVKGYSVSGVHGSDFSVPDPAGLAVGGGTVYVASRSGSVYRFPGAPFATTDSPRAIAVAPNGDVWVAEYPSGRVERYSASGTLLGGFDGHAGDGIAVDSSGDVYTTGDAVRRYDPSGTLLGTWNIGAAAIAIDSAKRVYVTQPSRMGPFGFVYRLDPSDESPSAALAATPDKPLATQLVTFDATGSTPPTLGHITKYEWDLDGDGTYETDGGLSPTISRRFQQVGTETVRVRVSGSNGLSATKSIAFNVGTPDAVLNAVPRTVLTGDPVSFDASGSIIQLSEVERFQWDLNGDGIVDVDTGTTPTLEHTFSTPQTTVVTVYVSRTGGRVDAASILVDVRLAPPAGEPGVSINDGDFATNDRHATLTLTWPAYSQSALVSNDGGFGTAGATNLFDVARHVSWTLPGGGADRLPRTVYVRYRPTDGGATYTDDIVLDEVLPVVTSASASHRFLRVKGADDNTGIRKVVVKRPRSQHVLMTQDLAPGHGQGRRRVNVKVRLPSGLKRAYARVVDVAGNRSRWRWISFR